MTYIDQEPSVVAPPTPLSPSIPNGVTLDKVTALARFEFEPGRGNDGTKVMMVEWQDDDTTRDKYGSWNVSWQGKSTMFPADDNPTDNIRRLYFLLPPGQIIPPHMTIAYIPPPPPPTDTTSSAEPLRMNITPLPAIFTPELGATAKTSGKKGVLHTIWAKRRLQVLEREIQREQDHNLEGIALEMALAEKEWIEQNFGLTPRGGSANGGTGKRPSMTLDMSNLKSSISPPQSPGLQSPKSPGGRRLTEKLKGLSISTTDRDLANRGAVNTPTRELHPLSPEVGDMAVSSFSAFRDTPLSAAVNTNSHSTTTTKRTMVAQAPPEHIRQQQLQNPASSLHFVAQNPPQQTPKFRSVSAGQNHIDDDDDDPEDLFAVALSPRSPDDPKSPFSIPSSEVGAFTRIKGEQA